MQPHRAHAAAHVMFSLPIGRDLHSRKCFWFSVLVHGEGSEGLKVSIEEKREGHSTAQSGDIKLGSTQRSKLCAKKGGSRGTGEGEEQGSANMQAAYARHASQRDRQAAASSTCEGVPMGCCGRKIATCGVVRKGKRRRGASAGQSASRAGVGVPGSWARLSKQRGFAV